jgi:ketosteroid isomerase-like protein
MSRENVEIAHRLADAVARQDVSLLIELTDPQVEWHSFVAQLQEGGVYRGHDGLRQYMKDLGEAFEVLQLTIDDTLAIGAVVLIVGRLRYRGKGSGVENESLAGYMLKVRRGKVLLLRTFREPEEVLEAVGLGE